MRLSEKDMAILAIGVAFSIVFFYMAHGESDTGQPRYEGDSDTGATTGFNVIDTYIDRLDTGDHYFPPAYCVPGQTQIFTAHRYPSVSGGSISTLIHQGFDALRRPAPQDDDWRTQPPGEVMWL